MTVDERAACYRDRFQEHPAAWPVTVMEGGHVCLYATWLIGADYRNKTRYFGAYPAGYLDRVLALFPDVSAEQTLHVFSGSLAAGPYSRCDLVQEAEFRCSVYELPSVARREFALILADPPYSKEDARKYGTPALNRGRAMNTLAAVTRPGGHVVWLDCVWPMFRKAEWRTVGRITIIRSTNHRVRMVSVFERAA